MAHMVESIFVVRKPAWHGLGTILPDAPTSKDAIVAAGLDWTVEKHKLFTDGHEIPNFFANVRSSDQSVLGVVSDRYEIIQNEEAFNFTDSLVDEGLTYESAGSLRDGKTIYLLGRLPKTTILGEDVEPYLCFTNTFDGSGAVQCCCTPTRVVCANTLNFALNTAKRKWSTRHVGDIQSKLHQAQITLGLANEYTSALSEEAERLVDTKVSDTEIEQMLDTLYPIKEDDSQQRKNNVQRLKDNFFYCLSQDDIKQFRGTMYAVMMAATDYADHSEPIRKTANFEGNRWFSVMQGHPFVDAMYKQIAAAA